MKKEESAEKVFDAIFNRDEGDYLNVRTVAKRSQLSAHQVRRAVRYLKEVMAGEYQEPIIWDPDRGYCFAETEIEANFYKYYRLRVMMIQMSNLISGTAEPAAAKFGSRTDKRIVRHLIGLREDIEELVDELSA